MSYLKTSYSKVAAICGIFWALAITLIIWPGTIGTGTTFIVLPIILMPAVLLTFAIIAISFFKISKREPKTDSYTHNLTARVLAGLLIAALAISTGAAIRSLWYSPVSQNFNDRFIYENVATTIGLASIGLALLLSALQKDIYWITRKKSLDLDERQLQERREVFEYSYKAGSLLVLVSIIWLNGKLWQMPSIISNNGGAMPGHIYWIGTNLIVALFALPLIVGAYKKTITRSNDT
jgi:hypothetical protein